MKKLLLACIMMMVSSNAFSWGLSLESVTSWGNETLEPVNYNVETNGNNIRVYEWVTPTAPHQKCVFVASENNTQLDCDIIENLDDVKPQSLLGE